MAPLIRRTWAQRGLTPFLPLRARRHEKLSGIGALVVSPRRRRITLYLALYARQNIRAPHVRRFVRHLRRHLRGPAVLLWDHGLPHRARLVRRTVDGIRAWSMVWLPPYAPELNPVEQLWTYLKYGRLANFAPDDLVQIRCQVRRETRRLHHRPELLKHLFRHSALPFRV